MGFVPKLGLPQSLGRLCTGPPDTLDEDMIIRGEGTLSQICEGV